MTTKALPSEQPLQKTDSFVPLNRHACRRLENSVAPADLDWTMAMMFSYVRSANWTGNPAQTNNGLAQGQLIAETEQQEADRYGVSRQRIQRRRKKLDDAGLIKVNSDRHKTVITVLHYDDLTRTPDKRSTDFGDFSQRNADSDPYGDQPTASAINQIQDSQINRCQRFQS